MGERDSPGVQRLPWKRPERRGERWIDDIVPPRLTVSRIANERPTPCVQMRTDLVRAPVASEQRRSASPARGAGTRASRSNRVSLGRPTCFEATVRRWCRSLNSRKSIRPRVTFTRP